MTLRNIFEGLLILTLNMAVLYFLEKMFVPWIMLPSAILTGCMLMAYRKNSK